MENFKNNIKLPQPDDIPMREKEDAMGAYLMMFAAWGIGLPLPFVSLIASIIYYYLNKNKSAFIGFHAFQSLITQVPISILNAGAVIWVISILLRETREWENFVIYIIFTGLLNLTYIVFSLIGAVKARRGEFYYFPFFGEVAFDKYYGPGAQAQEKRVRQNLPPKGY